MQVRTKSTQPQLADLVGILLAAGGPTTLPARVRWPLDQALVWLQGEAAKSGALDPWRHRIDLQLSPDSGTGVKGAGRALALLRDNGTLRPIGCLRWAAFRVDADALLRYRRLLMAMKPGDAQLLTRAARMWSMSVHELERIRQGSIPESAAV